MPPNKKEKKPTYKGSDPRSDEERKALAALKQALSTTKFEIPGEEWASTCGDAVQLRFLRGHKFKIDAAVKLLKKAGAWRKSYDADTLLQRFEIPNPPVDIRFARAYLPLGVIGHEYEGRPVTMTRLAAIDFPRILSEFDLNRAIEYMIYIQETLLRGNDIGEAVVILDLGVDDLANPPMSSILDTRAWVAGLLKFLAPYSAIVDPYYPETFAKIFIVRAPSMFAAVYSVAKTFIAENTIEKIAIYSNSKSGTEKALEAMRELIPNEIIPSFLGGGNYKLGIGQGGKLPKGGATDIKFIEQLEHEISIPKDGDKTVPKREGDDEIQRKAALDTLRLAVDMMAKYGGNDASSNQRGSWRFVPGLDILETINDDELEAALMANDNDPEKALASLQAKAQEKAGIKLPPPEPTPSSLNNSGKSNSGGGGGIKGAFNRLVGSFSSHSNNGS
jgi:hypothetical protein